MYCVCVCVYVCCVGRVGCMQGGWGPPLFFGGGCPLMWVSRSGHVASTWALCQQRALQICNALLIEPH